MNTWRLEQASGSPQPMAVEVSGAPSAYLRYLVTQDTKLMAQEIKARRAQLGPS